MCSIWICTYWSSNRPFWTFCLPVGDRQLRMDPPRFGRTPSPMQAPQCWSWSARVKALSWRIDFRVREDSFQKASQWKVWQRNRQRHFEMGEASINSKSSCEGSHLQEVSCAAYARTQWCMCKITPRVSQISQQLWCHWGFTGPPKIWEVRAHAMIVSLGPIDGKQCFCTYTTTENWKFEHLQWLWAL